jgi:hypothetical protein
MRKSKFFHKDFHPMKFKKGDPQVKVLEARLDQKNSFNSQKRNEDCKEEPAGDILKFLSRETRP